MDRVLCGASAESMKFFFNEREYGLLPEEVREGLKAMVCGCVEDAGGAMVMHFVDEGRLYIEAIDPVDEIGSELLIGRMRREHRDLFEKLEAFEKGLRKLHGEAATETSSGDSASEAAAGASAVETVPENISGDTDFENYVNPDGGEGRLC